MPIFHAHIKEKAYTPEEKKGLADALNLSLHEAMEAPMEDRFIVITEHKEEEISIHPTFPGMQRTEKAVIVEVYFGTSRTLDQKRKLAELIMKYAQEKAGCGEDDVSMVMLPQPLDNFVFGKGMLLCDMDMSMPWVNK